MAALVGMGAGAPLYLDLRTQGPHALVGGTTGAGKSEFLQAWVLGMAQALSPDRLSFLFVDYKGGSAFGQCTELPHFVGLVTDLSPFLVRRALTSLRAELTYREKLLNAKGAKDLVTLEKTGDPDCPPHLSSWSTSSRHSSVRSRVRRRCCGCRPAGTFPRPSPYPCDAAPIGRY